MLYVISVVYFVYDMEQCNSFMVLGYQGHAVWFLFPWYLFSTGSEVPKVKRGECVRCKHALSSILTHGLLANATAAHWRSYSAIGSQRQSSVSVRST